MTPSNYHTHTIYCDGKNTPEEMVLEAIRLGCPEIGFSGHSYTAFDLCCCMTPEGTREYKACIRELQKKYAGRIKIWLGVEQDYYSEEPTDDYDYVIGSVHYVKKNGEYLCVDNSARTQTDIVERYYQGDFYGFAEDYYDIVADVYRRTKCDIVGHFDLITKFNENGVLFDTDHPRYRAAAGKALDALLKTPVAFEVNTGAIARGYRTQPYPEKWILDRMRERGAKICRNSDAHGREWLLFGLNG